VGQIALKRPLPPGVFSDWHGAAAEKRGADVYFKYDGYFLTGDCGYVDE